MRVFQLTSKTRLARGDAREREEAIHEVPRQQRTALQIFDRLPLGAEYPFDSCDDFVAVMEEELKKLDVCLKRYCARMRPGRTHPGAIVRSPLAGTQVRTGGAADFDYRSELTIGMDSESIAG
jgi:hypothetical protein